MRRLWTGECRYCRATDPGRGVAWLTWYLSHLRVCVRFLDVERASRPTEEAPHVG